MYVKDGELIDLAGIRQLNPNMSIPVGADLTSIGYSVLIDIDPPEYDRMTHDAIGGVTFDKGQWIRTWTLVLRPIAPTVIPESVTMRQARLAMLGAGVLSAANDAIAAMPGVQGDAARIEWEYAQEVRRDAALVAGMATALGLSEAQLDGLFVAAAGL